MSENKNLPQNINVQKRREYLQSLVLAIYRVTATMPPTDYLRLRLREEALNIASHGEHLAAGNKDEYHKFIACAQTLVHYCEVAEQEQMHGTENFAVLKHALFNLRNSFELPRHDQIDDEHLVYLTNAKLEKEEHAQEQKEHTPTPASSGQNRTAEEDGKKNPSQSVVNNEPPIVTLAGNTNIKDAQRITNLREWNGGSPKSEPAPPENLPTENNNSNSQSQTNPAEKINIKRASRTTENSQELTNRQKRLLEHLKEHRTAEVKELANIFPSVSKRTIRRDLDKLSKLGHVRKDGRTNGTQYLLLSE